MSFDLSLFLPLCAAASLLSTSSPAAAQHGGDAPPAWIEAEKGILENHVQLTSEQMFRKAGECYFSPDDSQIIFQAVERKQSLRDEEPFYQMYVADIVRQNGRIVGTENIKRLSPPGSSNTCGWFHPTQPGVVVFGSTRTKPSNPDRAGYQRESSRYLWQFPQEMDIVMCEIAKADGTAATLTPLIENPDAYLAECVVSNDGRFMVFCEHQVAEGRSGGDLLVRDLTDGRTVPVTLNEGYDGGPFFSPDGKRLCYRSDRQGNDLLQIFVSELAFDHAGNVLGVAREFQLTDNVHVNWAPYWHPQGRHLVYATSEMGHENYEVFIIDADAGGEHGPARYGTRRRRVTHAPRFDGLPVFNRDGSVMMWTCQRSADGTSQVWAADFVMPLDKGAAAQPEKTAAEKPERLQVEDPKTGLYFIYDPATHELSVYNPETHKVRKAEGEEEIQRAMQLFKAQDDN